MKLTTAPHGAISFFVVVDGNIVEDDATCCLSVFISGVARRSFLKEKKKTLFYFNLINLTCPPDCIQLGTVSLTIVVSFDVEDNSSLISIVEFDDKIGLSFEFVFVGIFTFDNN